MSDAVIFIFGLVISAIVVWGAVLSTTNGFKSKETKSMSSLTIVIAILALWAVASALGSNVEEPEFTVTEERDGYEIREYSTHIVAEAEVESSGYDRASREGFGLVADYIFGNNTGEQKIAMTKPVAINKETASGGSKIAMTKPVITGENDPGVYTIGFVMPSEYSLESLPKPNNDRVQLREVPTKRVAVLSFSGWYASDDRSTKAKAKLMELVVRDNLTPLSQPVIARYNPPLTMPFMLRNEVMIDIE